MDVAADLVKNMFNKGHDADYLQWSHINTTNLIFRDSNNFVILS
jgi:hypothetical protein